MEPRVARWGRDPFLLDTNIAAKRAEDRAITNALYGGDLETRLRQEMLRGIGGYDALTKDIRRSSRCSTCGD